MKIFVTGGLGFLGSAFVKKLRSLGYEVDAPSSKQVNLISSTEINQFNQFRYDAIYHLAAWTQAGDFCLRHPGEQWLINQRINTTILEWWCHHQPQAKMTIIGTSCAYAPGADLREENYMRGEPVESLYTYAMTKRMLLQGVRALHQQYQLQWLCVVPSTLYGPGYHTDGRQMHFIFDLIRKILRGKYLGETVQLWGDGYQRRELVYLDDFINAVLHLFENTTNQLVNIGAGEDYTIREFAEKICQIVDFDKEKITYDTTRYVGADSKKLSTELLIRLMPEFYLSQLDLDIGLSNVIDWFRSEKVYIS